MASRHTRDPIYRTDTSVFAENDLPEHSVSVSEQTRNNLTGILRAVSQAEGYCHATSKKRFFVTLKSALHPSANPIPSHGHIVLALLFHQRIQVSVFLKCSETPPIEKTHLALSAPFTSQTLSQLDLRTSVANPSHTFSSKLGLDRLLLSPTPTSRQSPPP